MFKYILLFLSLTTSAFAHDWYPVECCSDRDCRPVPCDHLGENSQGQITYRGLTFQKHQQRPSQDSKCHVCIGGHNLPFCVFTLQGS